MSDETSRTPTTPALTLAIDDGGIATITIDNPARLNALTAHMWGELPALVAEATTDDRVRVIVLRGSGTKAFCTGADISEFATARTGDAVHVYDHLNHAAFDALTKCPKPTIAMIHGFCLGGGMGLALACDLRIGDENAQFGIPAAKLGIGYNPRWISPILRTVSPATAKLMLFTGRRFNAEEALQMGLVSELVPAPVLAEAVRALTSEIARNAPLSVKAAKVMIDDLWQPGEAANLLKLDRLVQACFESADYTEGQRAFLEKRKPTFKGH